MPSGHFFANAAWLLCAVLAHDLIRWTAMLGELTPADHLTVARTVRTRFFSVPGRLVSRSGTPTLRAPLEWPWAETLPSRPRPLAKPATGPRVGKLPAGGAPQTRASGADIDVHHLNAYFGLPRLPVTP